jgi:glycosyltransferase involved in cell wall biosynthesis
MRILMITDWPALEGGTERHVGLLRESLATAGDEVRLLTSGVGSAAGGSAEYVAYGSDRRVEQVALQVWNPSATRTVRRALREFEPHAVHLNMFLPYLSPAVLGPLRTVPTLVLVHDYKPICPTGTKMLPDGADCTNPAGRVCWQGGCISLPRALRDAPRYGILRAGLRAVDRVQTLSRLMQEMLARSGISADRVDPPVPMPAPRFVRRPAAEPLFVYAGRLAPVKGVDVLVRALARLLERVPTARLRILGDGRDRQAIQTLAAELGVDDAVSFRFGMDPRWQAELSSAWALVAPSVYREPLGLVAVEAIVHGVPVIASEGGGFAETIDAGTTGLLVPNGDVAALADAMRSVAERRSFPSQAIPDSAVSAMRALHDPVAYAQRTRAVLRGIQGTAAA